MARETKELTEAELKSRAELCATTQKCFVSLEPLDDYVAEHHPVVGTVMVNKEYIKY